MKLYSRFSNRGRLPCKLQGNPLTQQCFKDECDLGLLIKTCTRLSMPLPSPHRVPMYVNEIVSPSSLAEAMNVVIRANEDFASLPFKVRERFNHDPKKFVAFCCDDKNRDEALALGLIRIKEEIKVNANNVTSEEVTSVNEVSNTSNT